MLRKSLVLFLWFGLLAAGPGYLAAQDVPPSEINPVEIQWLWGEVVSVDPGQKNLTVKYLDYDTDEEKTMVLLVTNATTFQEASGLEAIKAQDTVSVEYVVKENRSYARDITVEQIEDAGEESAYPQELPPEKVGQGPVAETDGPLQPGEPPR